MKELAQLKTPGYDTPIQAPSGIPTGGSTSVGTVMGMLLGILIALAVMAAVGFMLWGAIQWITSQGDKQKVAKARSTIIAAIIGLIIVIFAFFIVNSIGGLLGVPGLQNITK